MYQRLLSLLLALPLLLPQGVCVCDFMQTCEACAECTVTVEPEKPPCGCRKHKRSHPVKDDSPVIAKSHTCHTTAPDKQDRHAPGCPAKEGSAQWKANTAQPTAQLAVEWSELVGVRPEIPAASSAISTPSFHLSTAETPLYLTLLTLRI